eukprot:5937756-Pyramimonas_sp.AAC.1
MALAADGPAHGPPERQEHLPGALHCHRHQPHGLCTRGVVDPAGEQGPSGTPLAPLWTPLEPQMTTPL